MNQARYRRKFFSEVDNQTALNKEKNRKINTVPKQILMHMFNNLDVESYLGSEIEFELENNGYFLGPKYQVIQAKSEVVCDILYKGGAREGCSGDDCHLADTAARWAARSTSERCRKHRGEVEAICREV